VLKPLPCCFWRPLATYPAYAKLATTGHEASDCPLPHTFCYGGENNDMEVGAAQPNRGSAFHVGQEGCGGQKVGKHKCAVSCSYNTKGLVGEPVKPPLAMSGKCLLFSTNSGGTPNMPVANHSLCVFDTDACCLCVETVSNFLLAFSWVYRFALTTALPRAPSVQAAVGPFVGLHPRQAGRTAFGKFQHEKGKCRERVNKVCCYRELGCRCVVSKKMFFIQTDDVKKTRCLLRVSISKN